MKKYIYRLFMLLVATASMVSCAEDEGANPGNDSNPAITVYKYAVSRPYNVDNDVAIRFATNNKTTEAFYLVEKTADKQTRITSVGENGYMDYVVTNGIKLTNVSGEANVDITLTDLYGEYTITAVAANQGTRTSAEITFTGLDWTDVVSGTYYFAQKANSGTASANVSKVASNPAVLQVCTTNANLYRFKDAFGTGYHLKINLIDIKGKDADGEYQFFRVPVTETPYAYGTYGNALVRDIGYWQGSDAWVTTNGYESGMYTDYYCFIFIQWYVSAGSIGYGYDEFVPD